MNKAIFWDFDGTLVHKNESFAHALYSAVINNGYSIEENLIKESLHGACSWYAPETSYTDNTGSKWWDTLCGKVHAFCKSNNIANSASFQISEEFKQNATNYDYALYNDAEDILAYCSDNNYRNYLLSNNFPELIDTIAHFGLDKYFSGYFISSNIGYEKPHRKIFEHAVDAAGYPEFCYMVGDNPVADISGAKSAGLITILVHDESTSVIPDHICKELSDIKKSYRTLRQKPPYDFVRRFLYANYSVFSKISISSNQLLTCK